MLKSSAKVKVPLRIKFIAMADGMPWIAVFVPPIGVSIVHGVKDGFYGALGGGIAGLILSFLLGCWKTWGSRHYPEVLIFMSKMKVE